MAQIKKTIPWIYKGDTLLLSEDYLVQLREDDASFDVYCGSIYHGEHANDRGFVLSEFEWYRALSLAHLKRTK